MKQIACMHAGVKFIMARFEKIVSFNLEIAHRSIEEKSLLWSGERVTIMKLFLVSESMSSFLPYYFLICALDKELTLISIIYH